MPRLTDDVDASLIREVRNRTPEAGRLPEVLMDHGDFHVFWAIQSEVMYGGQADQERWDGGMSALQALHNKLWPWCSKEQT